MEPLEIPTDNEIRATYFEGQEAILQLFHHTIEQGLAANPLPERMEDQPEKRGRDSQKPSPKLAGKAPGTQRSRARLYV